MPNYRWWVATASGLAGPYRNPQAARDSAVSMGSTVVRTEQYCCEQCGRDFECVDGGEPDDLDVCSEECRDEWLQDWSDSLFKGATP